MFTIHKIDDIESSIFIAVDLQVPVIHLFVYEILITVFVVMNELLDSICYGLLLPKFSILASVFF